jgi:hypothetical protein
MTDNQKKLSRREMSTAEGVRADSDTIRDRSQNSSADLTVGTPPVCGEPGYHRIHGEETKPVPEASSIAYQSRCETARDLAPDADRLSEPVCAHRETDAATKPSSRPAVSAPGGKAGRLQDPRVSDRNAGTHASPPALTTPASSAESSDGDARGRSSRSSPRPVTPVTWRRGADVESGLMKEEPPVDSGEQADKAWLLDIQRKLYTWSRTHPGEAWQDMWGWLTSPRNLRVAWRRVASNRGARSAGVDRLTVKQVEQRIGVERFLGDLGERLRSGQYLPSPVRRVMIPKRGKPGQFRPLGVPSRLYLVPSSGLENIDVPDEPCRDHIEVALEVIRDAIGDFPFVDQASYANAIGAIVTSVCRHIISGPVPVALFDATTQGTGKTLLAEVIAIILTGRAAELMSAPTDPDEWRKQLTSILIEAPPLVVIDNVTTTLDSGDLAKVITGEMHRDRVLGKSQTVSVPVRCSWIATGNNLQLGGDMARRCYWIRMDAGCSDPFRRTGFKHDRLKEYLVEHRRELLIALLTLARAWFAAGQPRSTVPPVGSFERWTEVVSGILQYAGVEGFLANSEKLFEQSDIERSDWETFLEAVEDTFQGAPFTIAEFWERLNEKSYEELIRQSVLTDRAEELRNALPTDLTRWMDREGQFKQRLGVAFNSRRGRRFGKRQMRVERASADAHGKVARWKVVADA